MNESRQIVNQMRAIFTAALIAALVVASAAEAGERNPMICDRPPDNPGIANNRVPTIEFYHHSGTWHNLSLNGCEAATCLAAAGWSGGTVLSSNASVAMVDSSGAIQPLGLGIATLTAQRSGAPLFVYVEVRRVDSAYTDPYRPRGFDFVDWTSHVEIKKGKLDETSIWASTQVITITNRGDVPLRSGDVVLRIENLTRLVGAAQICPGPRTFIKGETTLTFPREFLLPGESQDFSIVFVNAAKKKISFTPKVLWAHAVASAPSTR